MKYMPKTQFIVNGVDMSRYVNAVEYRMVVNDLDIARVSLVGATLDVITDDTGRKVVKISIGKECTCNT